MPRSAAIRKRAAGTLAAALAALPDRPVAELKERWERLYGAPPPARLGRTLLTYGVAWRLQEEALGGFSPATSRRLKQGGEAIAAGRAPAPPPALPKPGTRLLREWHGVMHEAIVLEQGVQYRDRVWPSLSAVAREITGTRWSGPLFFGLKARRHG